MKHLIAEYLVSTTLNLGKCLTEPAIMARFSPELAYGCVD
jgi:hypothetical protein